MEKKKATKLAPNSKIKAAPKTLKKEFNNLQQKSQITPSSNTLPKENGTLKQNSQHESSSTNLKKENDKFEAVPPIASAIKIRKIQNEKKEDLNKYLSFYQSSKTIPLNNLGKHLTDKMKVCPLCDKTIDLQSYNTHFDNHPSKILDWLYIGSYNNATNKKELELFDIKYILNCAVECRNLFPDNIRYCHLKLSDQIDTDLYEHFEDAFNFLHEAYKSQCKVLVHCQLGKSRSAAMVIGYIMKALSKSYEEAYKTVKSSRKIALPNLGFVYQLKDLQARKTEFSLSTR